MRVDGLLFWLFRSDRVDFYWFGGGLTVVMVGLIVVIMVGGWKGGKMV